MDQEQIEQLVEEAKAGSIEKYGIIIEMLQQPIFKYCYHMLGQREEAEDAVQEVFIKAYENLDKYSHTVSFSSWVYKIAYHHCLNLIKRAKSLRVASFLRIGTPFMSRNEGELKVDSEYLSEPLHIALSNLSAEERNLIILRVVEEKGYEELSILLNKKTATLRKQYERALKKCKHFLHAVEGGGVNEHYSAIR
ncbi:RNA polymerase sigma factor [Brevibacillus ginsengisoli]|uniref:RNA polymerase sigma factor n=1 Tax=Brevibacillus ginsengisoli TaxID=363854 RepID=UPI003CEC323E